MPKGDIMKDAEMDHILSTQDEILPSSGFVASVMEAVRREAAAPDPIPFPWRRALPVLVLAVFSLAGVAVFGVLAISQVNHASQPQDVASLWRATLPILFQGPTGSSVGWTALALLGALVSVKLSMRLAGNRA